MALLADSLRPLLLDPAQAGEIDVRGATEAAVLVPLHSPPGGPLSAVFTRRHNDMRRHAGEISFPGGRREPADASLLATAVREAYEEIGLAAKDIEVLGALQPTPTIVTGFAVYPFVGLIARPPAWRLNSQEVAGVIELPIADLIAGYGRRRVVRRGMAIRTDTYVVDGNLIWGATARILADLLDRISLIGKEVGPRIGDGATALAEDGASPRMGDDASPLTGDGASPLAGDKVTTLAGDGASPLTSSGASPLTGDGASPVTSDQTARRRR
jgi:8-oxo-dGTP pyrophosphatase MutT (NUDIX family)